MAMNEILELFFQPGGGFLHQPILDIGLLLLVGYILGKTFERIGLPAITGYIIGGLVLSPSVTGLITKEMSHSLHILTDIALSFIALTIGGEFSIAKIRRTGMRILVITLFESIFAFIVSTAFVHFIGVGIYESLLLGAISSATAPAATVIIIRTLRARGDFVDHIYGVVAFDDAVCVVLFSIAFAIVTSLVGEGGGGEYVLLGVAHAFLELGLSCLFGLIFGVLLNLTIRKMYQENEIMIIALAVVLVNTACMIGLGLSPLIANMFLGATLINLSTRNRRVFTILEPLTPPLFALFFIIAGNQLDIGIFRGGPTVLFGLIYILGRFSGKYIGAFLGSTLSGAPKRIRNFLGFCLSPQAGVAVGLALFIQSTAIPAEEGVHPPLDFSMIVNIVLFAVFLNAIIGPIMSRFGIIRGTGIGGKT
jgi:Kef-type K+ transport system membrane component KefB